MNKLKFPKQFPLSELTRSTTATDLGLDNTPTQAHLKNLHTLAWTLIPIRLSLNKPMIVSSGYRSEALNKAVGGSLTSDHSKGMAVDFVCPQYGSTELVVNHIIEMGVPFKQLILEYSGNKSWVHFAIAENAAENRMEVLTYKDGKYYKGVVTEDYS